MQYATILLGFLVTLAATAPTQRQSKETRALDPRADGPLRVTLETDFFGGLAAELLATSLGEADAKAPTFPGPFATVALDVGDGTPEARCQLIDTDGRVVTLVRGANVDVSFGDGGNGAWRAQDGGTFSVKQIKCDPEFKSAN